MKQFSTANLLVGWIVFSWLGLANSMSSAQPPILVAPNSRTESMGSIIGMPPEQAIATALLPEYESIRPGILNIVFQRWSIQDPENAYAAYESLPTSEYSYLLESQILQYWLLTDPEAALAKAAYSNNEESFALVIRDAAFKNPRAAIAATEVYASKMGSDEWRAVIEGVGSNDSLLAAQLVASMQPEGEYLIESFIYSLAREDVIASIQWLLTNFPDSLEFYEAIASIFYIQDSAAAFEYISRLPTGPIRDSYAQALLRAEETNDPVRYEDATPEWVPLLDACTTNGTSRSDCILSLPPDVLSDLEAQEARNGGTRRRQLRERNRGFGVRRTNPR